MYAVIQVGSFQFKVKEGDMMTMDHKPERYDLSHCPIRSLSCFVMLLLTP